MATMLFDRIVKSGDTVRHPFVGNVSGETWTAKVFEVGTGAGGTDTEITSGITVGSAVTNTGLYHLTLAPGGLTANRQYYAYVTRGSDGAVIRFPAWAYAPTNDVGQSTDSDTTASVFGRIKHVNDGLGVDSFFGAGTNLYSMLTGANGLSVIKGATDTLKTDTGTIKSALAGDITTAFDGGAITGSPTSLAQALKKIYDSAANPWLVDISGATTAGQAGTMLKTVTGSVGLKNDAASADYTDGTVQAKLRKLGEYVNARLPATGYANSTTDVAAGQAAIYSQVGLVKTKTDLIGNTGDAANVDSLFGRFAVVTGKTNLIGATGDTSSDATLFGRIAGVGGKIGAASDNSAAATVFGKVAEVKGLVGSNADLSSATTLFGRLTANDENIGKASDGSGVASVYGKIAAVKAETVNIGASGDAAGANTVFGKIGTTNSRIGQSADAADALSLFGKLAAIKAVVDHVNVMTNAKLVPTVPNSFPAPASSLTDGVAVKFDLQVQDPITGLEDPDDWNDSGTTRYKAHVRVTDHQGNHWGARLYSDKNLSIALGTSAGGANEPAYSASPLGGGAASESFRRLAREAQGLYTGYLKVLPADKASLSFLFQVVDSDPTNTPATFAYPVPMTIESFTASFPQPGGF